MPDATGLELIANDLRDQESDAVLGTVFFAFAARKALPSRGGLAVLPAVAASLWLVGLGAELIADAQTGAALERLRHQADDFRRGRSI